MSFAMAHYNVFDTRATQSVNSPTKGIRIELIHPSQELLLRQEPPLHMQ
jgi:hypothetical protein